MGRRGKNAKESFTVEWLLFHTVNFSTEKSGTLSSAWDPLHERCWKTHFNVIRCFIVVPHQTHQETANGLKQRLQKMGFPCGIFYCYSEEKIMKNMKKLKEL